MPRVQPFTVISDLPEKLAPLRTLATNMWWTWNHQAKGVFIRIFKDRYVKARKNAVELVNSLSRAEIEQLERDKSFVAMLRDVDQDFKNYLEAPSWWQSHSPEVDNLAVAYFSAEFGLHESVPIYSGGLGVLAGDYLKAASDLGLPVVAVGLLYYEGYFSQYLSADGWHGRSAGRCRLSRVRAWFLGGIESLRPHRSVRDDARFDSDPEAPRDAKGRLRQLMLS